MIFDYCVPRYKSTYMFKTLCNWAILWDPHFINYHFGPHKNYKISLSSLYSGRPNEGFKPLMSFFLAPPFSHSLLPLFPSSLKNLKGSIEASLEINNFFKNEEVWGWRIKLRDDWKLPLKI